MRLYYDQITEPLLVQAFATLFSLSFILCLVIIFASGYGFFATWIFRSECRTKCTHTGFVPRVGGLAVFISIVGLIPLMSFGFIPLSVVLDLNSYSASALILSAIPVFIVGLAEDLGYPMSPRARLIGSAISSILALLIFRSWLTKLGIPGFDILLTFFLLFSVLFTVFATVGVVNAFNLIDGLNGLSSYVTVSTAISLSIIAFQVGNVQTTLFLLLLVAAVLGFMIFEFSFWKDFFRRWRCLCFWTFTRMVFYFNDKGGEEEISAFSVLLIFFWPVADTGLAIWRRWKLGNPADRPDRLHFHQLAMRFLEIRFFGRDKRGMVNPISTIILIPMISMPQALGVLFWNNFSATVLCTALMGLLFVLDLSNRNKLSKS